MALFLELMGRLIVFTLVVMWRVGAFFFSIAAAVVLHLLFGRKAERRDQEAFAAAQRRGHWNR